MARIIDLPLVPELSGTERVLIAESDGTTRTAPTVSLLEPHMQTILAARDLAQLAALAGDNVFSTPEAGAAATPDDKPWWVERGDGLELFRKVGGSIVPVPNVLDAQRVSFGVGGSVATALEARPTSSVLGSPAGALEIGYGSRTAKAKLDEVYVTPADFRTVLDIDDTNSFALFLVHKGYGRIPSRETPYSISGNIVVNGAAIEIIQDPDALIVAPNLTGHWFNFIGGAVRWENPACEGWETEAQFAASISAAAAASAPALPNIDTHTWSAMRFSVCRAVLINPRGLRSAGGGGLRCFASFVNCPLPYVSGGSVTGFMSADNNNSIAALAQYASAIRVQAGNGATIENFWAYQVGSQVLAHSTPTNGKIIGGGSRYAKDNGVYVSSGLGWLVTGFSHSDTAKGYGVKTRGSLNVISNGTITNTHNGVSQTGMGQVLDAKGANGYGNACIGVKVDGYVGHAFSFSHIEGQGENELLLFQRDHTFANCSMSNKTGGAEFAAVRAIYVGGGCTISNIVIDGFSSASAASGEAFLVGGQVGASLTGLSISGVHFRNVSNVLRCMNLYYVTRPKVSDVTAENAVTRLIQLSAAVDGEYRALSHPTGQALFAATGSGTTGGSVANCTGTFGIPAAIADTMTFLPGTNTSGRRSVLPDAVATYDPPAIAAGGVDAIQTISVPGAALGDAVVFRSFTRDMQGLELHAWVSAVDTVSYQFRNPTAAAVNLLSGNVRVRVSKA
ncbi:MAG: hypothetical protein ACK4K7_06730 [Allosphingosinicella sp.]|uniref:hypothetical protein n=1 Tax=Allosphingosinicella sp. TaxID=2823234 RepID=UPI00392AA1BD